MNKMLFFWKFVLPFATIYAITSLCTITIAAIENFLSRDEVHHFINIAKKQGLKKSHTIPERDTDKPIMRLMDMNRDRKLSVDEVGLHMFIHVL